MKDRKSLRPEGSMQVRSIVKTAPVLNREIQTKIGQQLRAVYDDVVDQGVPERFVALLRHIEKEAEAGKAEEGDKDSQG